MTDTFDASANTSTAPSETAPERTPTMDAVFKELTTWRDTKHKHKQSAIPDTLWHKIIVLGQKHGVIKIRGLFAVDAKQYDKKYKQLFRNVSEPSTVEDVQLCKVNTTPVNAKPAEPPTPVYQARDIPQANNVTVVELCRSDGQTMKIHTTTDNFKTIITTFFEGHHA